MRDLRFASTPFMTGSSFHNDRQVNTDYFLFFTAEIAPVKYTTLLLPQISRGKQRAQSFLFLDRINRIARIFTSLFS